MSNKILTGFESGKSTGMMLIDLQKAFGTLDHDILLDKMKYLGFTSKIINWFGSYLKERNIVLSLEKTLSDTGILNCGTPQRSILGPILFLLYENDIKTTLKNCNLRFYADDPWILHSHQNVKFIERNLNYDFTYADDTWILHSHQNVKFIERNLNYDFTYADDTWILHSHQNVKFIERSLNYDFNNFCGWFIENKLYTFWRR